MYSIVIAVSAEKSIRRIEKATKNRMTEAILALAGDPRPAGCIKLKSEEGIWRIRVGEYRIAYTIDDSGKVVTILRVGPRGNFYNWI